MTAKTKMFHETCCRCGIVFGMPVCLRDTLLGDGSLYFYCPNGHRLHYPGVDREQELSSQLSFTRDRLTSLRESNEYLKRRLAATQGVVTKMRNKIHAYRDAVGECERLDDGRWSSD